MPDSDAPQESPAQQRENRRERLIQSFSDRIEAFCKSHFDTYWKALEQSFQRLSDLQDATLKPGTNSVFDNLNRQRQALEEQFIGHLLESIGDFRAKRPIALLSTPDTRGRDSANAIDMMARRSERRGAEQLYTLNQRLSAVNTHRIEDSENPVAPEIFARAIDQALIAQTLPAKFHIAALKVFDNEFMPRLTEFYQQINQFLSNEGILRHIKSEAIETGEAPTPEPVQVPPLAQVDEVKVDRIDNDVIETVGIMFESILQDAALPDYAKAKLSGLHTAYIKVALIDKSFFNSVQHPARLLLNTLVDAGERFLDQDNEDNKLFQQIEHIVDRIQQEFNKDLSIFSELAFEFTHYLRHYQQRIANTENRAKNRVQGKERLQVIRDEVRQILSEKMGDSEIPRRIHKLLFDPWSNYLAYLLLRSGRDSEDWQNALQAVDSLLWLVMPKPDWNPRQEDIESQFRELVATLGKGMLHIGHSKNDVKVVVDEIRRCHKLARQGLHPDKTVQVTPPSPGKSSSAAQQAVIAKLVELEFGTWFTVHCDNPQQQRQVKLAWFNERTLRFMFVNRAGQQVNVIDAHSFADDILSGRTKLSEKQEHERLFAELIETQA